MSIKKKIVLPSKHDPFLYGFINSYLEYLEEDGEYEDYVPYNTEHEFHDIDRGFFTVEKQEEWNHFILNCDLQLLWFVDEHFEVIQQVLENVGRFVMTTQNCLVFENYKHLKALYEDAGMEAQFNQVLKREGMFTYIQECLEYFGEEEFEDILEYGKAVKKVNYTVSELIEQVEAWNYNNINYNSFVHKFYDEEYEAYLLWCAEKYNW